MSLVTIRALFCPGCGAPLDPGEQTQLRCAYCDSVLRIQQQRVSQTETSSTQLSALDLPRYLWQNCSPVRPVALNSPS